MDTIRPFFSKIRGYCRFLKKGRKSLPPVTPPPSLCYSPISIDEDSSMSLNISKYPWKAWMNCSDFGRALNMLDHLTCSTGFLKMAWVLNVSWFWIWWCICYMTQYVSITPKCFSVHLNAPEYAWSWLKITEFPWVSLEMPE